MLGNFLVDERLAASQEGLCSTELVSKLSGLELGRDFSYSD
jgi:hypothetical protein